MLAALVLSLVRPSILMRTLAIKNIAEVRMKRQWNVRRQFQPATNAERRWDQATNISCDGPYRATRFPFYCLRFALRQERR